MTLVLVQRRRLRPLRRRWKGAVQTLISTAELVRDADTLADDGAAPADRCATARSSGRAAEAPSWPHCTKWDKAADVKLGHQQSRMPSHSYGHAEQPWPDPGVGGTACLHVSGAFLLCCM